MDFLFQALADALKMNSCIRHLSLGRNAAADGGAQVPCPWRVTHPAVVTMPGPCRGL